MPSMRLAALAGRRTVVQHQRQTPGENGSKRPLKLRKGVKSTGMLRLQEIA